MDTKDTKDLWNRRGNSNKLSLATNNNNGGSNSDNASGSRNGSFAKRFGDQSSSHGGKSNPFDSLKTPGGSLASPTATSASNAFGLGSGAFASFGSAKTPKTPGNPFDMAMGLSSSKGSAADKAPTTPGAIAAAKPIGKPPSMGSIAETETPSQATPTALPSTTSDQQLAYKWIWWSRPPPTSKTVDYDKTLLPMLYCQTLPEFHYCFSHLKKPSQLAIGYDYAFFKDGIRPMWEDEANKKGGKWVVRVKKFATDLLWEHMLAGLVGNHYWDGLSDEVCGGVVSVREDNDTLSLWIRSKDKNVEKICERLRVVLSWPNQHPLKLEFKPHDSSLQQRANQESRRERAASSSHTPGEKRFPGGLLAKQQGGNSDAK